MAPRQSRHVHSRGDPARRRRIRPSRPIGIGPPDQTTCRCGLQQRAGTPTQPRILRAGDRTTTCIRASLRNGSRRLRPPHGAGRRTGRAAVGRAARAAGLRRRRERRMVDHGGSFDGAGRRWRRGPIPRGTGLRVDSEVPAPRRGREDTTGRPWRGGAGVRPAARRGPAEEWCGARAGALVPAGGWVATGVAAPRVTAGAVVRSRVGGRCGDRGGVQ